MQLSEIAPGLIDERCRQAFAKLREAIEDTEDWRYVITPEFISTDYIVSDLGRVMSLPRYRHYEASAHSKVKHRKFQPGGLRRPGTQPSGHQTIILSYQKKLFRTHVHRLVAWAFLGPQPAGHFVRHLDGDPANNRLSNLAYGTPWNNITDTFGPAGSTGIGIVIGASLERRIDAALRGESEAHSVLAEIHELLERSRQNL